MSLVSINVLREEISGYKGSGRRATYDFLALSVWENSENQMKKKKLNYDGRIAFWLTDEMMGRAKLQVGVRLEFLYDSIGKMLVLRPGNNGSSAIYKSGKSNRRYSVTYPYYKNRGLPWVEGIVALDSYMHFQKGDIVIDVNKCEDITFP